MSSLRLTNGKIFTGNPTAPWAKEMLIVNGRIAWIGQGDAPSIPGVETMDLDGRLALPGLVDAHVHFLWYALGLDNVRMVGVENLEQALGLVEARVKNSSLGDWIVGDSYNHNVWGMDREPDRYDLDKVAPHNPVLISSKCGHTAWVNSKALELAGVTSATPDPEGARIERDAQGEPTGLLREGAKGLVSRVIPATDRKSVV